MSEKTNQEPIELPNINTWQYREKYIRQLMTFLSAIISLIGCGLSIATIIYLSLEGEFFYRFQSLFCAAVIFSVVILSVLLKILEKKIFYNISAIFLIITGSLFISYNEQYNRLNVDLIFAASFFSGLIFGISILTFVTHCGEVSVKHLRGSIASHIQFSIDFGLFLGIAILTINKNVFSADNPFEIIGSLQIVCGLLGILTANFLVYESPIYLFEMGKETKAIQNITQLKKELNEACYEVRTEIDNIRLILANKSNSVIKSEDIKSIVKVFFCRIAYSLSTSFFISVMLLATFQFSQELITIAMFFGRFIANIIPIFMIDSLGRKKILATSLIGSGIFLFLTIGAKLLTDLIPELDKYLVLIVSFIYNIFLGLGSSSVGYTYMSEVFDYSRKTYINALIIALEYIVHLIIYSISLENSIVVISILVFPAIMQLVIGGLSIVLMPETKRKTLVEAEHLMRK